MQIDAPQIQSTDLFPSPDDAADINVRPRVLMIVESAGGGTGRHVLDLSEGLIARGCDVHLVYSTGRVDQLFLDRLKQIGGLRFLAMEMRTSIHPSDIGVVRAVRRYAREFGPFDVIHGHSSKGGAIARLAALGTKAIACYTLHGLIMMDPGMSRLKRLFYLAIELGMNLRTSRIIAVSPEEQRAAVGMGFSAKRMALVPNGIDSLDLTPRDDARRVIGAREDQIVVGFVGRLVSQKAIDVLIEAFAIASACAPQLRLALVGGGPLEEALRAQASELGVGRKIIWLGERDARGVLSAFDVFALASRKEGLPYVILEAMVAGLPIVATASAGAESLVKTGVNGTVVPMDDVAGFAAALVELARDPKLLARQGQASLQHVARFSIDAMVDRTLAAYTSGLAGVPAMDTRDASQVLEGEDVAATA